LKEENIHYRLKRARETYQDADFLFQRGSINSSVNRLYYAIFYATIALFLHYDLEVKSHKSVKQKLGKDFVLKGLISKEHAKVFSLLSDYRHKGDYDDLHDFDKEIVERLFIPTKEYIKMVEELIL
jgi:uncharacterized protein (UPF0332 family)